MGSGIGDLIRKIAMCRRTDSQSDDSVAHIMTLMLPSRIALAHLYFRENHEMMYATVNDSHRQTPVDVAYPTRQLGPGSTWYSS
jgi:hypothetical protein